MMRRMKRQDNAENEEGGRAKQSDQPAFGYASADDHDHHHHRRKEKGRHLLKKYSLAAGLLAQLKNVDL